MSKDSYQRTKEDKLMTFFYAWKVRQHPRAEVVMNEFCRFIAGRGYPGDAEALFSTLESLDVTSCAVIVQDLIGEYAPDMRDAPIAPKEPERHIPYFIRVAGELCEVSYEQYRREQGFHDED